jgi:hypothetical protein
MKRPKCQTFSQNRIADHKRDLFEFAIVNELLQTPCAVEIVLKNLLTIVTLQIKW